jgi:putative ATPase
MKDLDYGKGYRYSHDYEGGYAEQVYLPEKIEGKKFYSPTDHGYEKSIKERMNHLKMGSKG